MDVQQGAAKIQSQTAAPESDYPPQESAYPASERAVSALGGPMPKGSDQGVAKAPGAAY